LNHETADEAKEGAADVIDAVAAVESLVSLGEQTRGQERGQEEFQVAEALLAKLIEPAAQGSQAGAPGREKGVCITSIYTCLGLTARVK